MCEMLFAKTWIICRVCLNQKDEMFNLFDDTIHKNIWLLLRDCSGVPVRRSDDFPDKICEACLNRLWDAMNFRIDCQRSHRELLQKQLEKNVFLYEEENGEEFLKMSKPNSLNSTIGQEDPDISATTNSDESENQTSATTNNNEIFSHNTKQYCVVERNAMKKTNSGVSKESQAKQPIVLLLRLKNTSYEETQTETMKTEAEAETHKKLNGKTKNVKLKKNSPKMMSKTFEKISFKPKMRKWKIQHTCNVCKNTYKTKELLRHHSYIHKRPYECKICHKKFGQIQSFLSHNNYHSGIKPYYCRICFETFADICNRNGHERQRHKNTQFKCRKCDKSFRLLALLRKHAQTHRPKKCFICDKEFSSLQMVRLHHQRLHLKLLYK